MIAEFNPLLTPYDMLELGIFDGSYFTEEEQQELSCPTVIRSTNLFMPNASQPMSAWLENGWITPEDPRGWVQWYLRYYHGRRIPELDTWQIKRYRSFTARHSAQVRKNAGGDLTKRRKQRQALLHWGSDPIPDLDIQNKVCYLKSLAKDKDLQ